MLKNLLFKRPVLSLIKNSGNRIGSRLKSTFRYVEPKYQYLFNNEVLTLLDNTMNKFKDRHNNLLEQRKSTLSDIYKKTLALNFRSDTLDIRKDKTWTGSSIPDDLQCRHVEITGPSSDPKMFINAMNSGANGYMTDIEDSNSPNWDNIVKSQHNIFQGVRNQLVWEKKDDGGNSVKKYFIDNTINLPALWVRLRGLHLMEFNVLDNYGDPYPAMIFDLTMHMHHNAKYLSDKNKGPYIYIPKLENYEEALLVNDIIESLEQDLNIEGTKVTALIETLPAIFQTQEIMYALRKYIVGLNCGRWDYLFSFIKSYLKDSKHILPDRNLLDMNTSFMEEYVNKIVKTTHERDVHAMGGMSAFIPGKDSTENAIILDKISSDKILEIKRGCDGAWVAHPGLVKPVQDLFSKYLGVDNQINFSPNIISKHENNTFYKLTYLDNDLITKENYTIKGLKQNINTSLQYMAAWLYGNGAVAINNMMEDMATAEIACSQLKQWLYHEIELKDGDNYLGFDVKLFESVLDSELQSLLKESQVPYATNKLSLASQIIKEYVSNIDYQFLPDIAYKYLRNNNSGIQFTPYDLQILRGSNYNLTGIELTKHRGEYLNNYLSENGKGMDRNKHPFYQFLGTSTGISAVNVVAGGKGHVGPYAGGWQTNAMKNRLSELLPDTLHVSPEEPAICAIELNNHLDKADKIQHLRETQIFSEIQNLSEEDKLNKLEEVNNAHISYYDTALLADMEQGWSTPEKIRMSVKKAIDNGVNVIHVEDQGPKKRCGHLGDKELDTIESYCMILKSANLAAQEKLGIEQSTKQWVHFVARTDAFSAKRIVYSENLKDTNHPEYKFIDWEKGLSKDGKYLYLKQGLNPDTGKKWGLELSIQRGAEVVKRGLATHVWMETPDAEVRDAKDFIEGVNKKLEPFGVIAKGLYNHSPSFDWDIKFYKDAIPLADLIVNNFEIDTNLKNNDLERLRELILKQGNILKGDNMFSDEYLTQILVNILDYHKGEETWKKELIEQQVKIDSENITIYNYKQNKELTRILKYGYNPLHHIRNIIVAQRLKNFEIVLASFGYNLHLITLPEFHIISHNMHQLSKEFKTDGIYSYVKLAQRPERKKSEIDNSYTYYKHQTATGTGIEAIFNSIVGSHDVQSLAQSTESDDLKKRAKK